MSANISMNLLKEIFYTKFSNSISQDKASEMGVSEDDFAESDADISYDLDWSELEANTTVYEQFATYCKENFSDEYDFDAEAEKEKNEKPQAKSGAGGT